MSLWDSSVSRLNILTKATAKECPVMMMRKVNVAFCIFLALSFRCWANSSGDVAPYDLPVLPLNLPAHGVRTETYDKFVPRKIWIAVKDKNDELPGHLKAFLQRNAHWDATVCDNDCKDGFMNTTFAGNRLRFF
jgi:hypothetical protein